MYYYFLVTPYFQRGSFAVSLCFSFYHFSGVILIAARLLPPNQFYLCYKKISNPLGHVKNWGPALKRNSKSRGFPGEPKARRDQDTLTSILCEHPVYEAPAPRPVPNRRAAGGRREITAQPPMHRCRVWSRGGRRGQPVFPRLWVSLARAPTYPPSLPPTSLPTDSPNAPNTDTSV